MEDKRTLFFPASLFAIFFVLIAFTGFFQIRIIKENIEGILQAEGEILSKSIQQETDRNIEYLNLLGKSPAIITPIYLNVLSYDEAIVDDLYDELSKRSLPELDRTSYRHLLVADEKGRQVERKGSISVPPSYFEALLKRGERTVLKMPSDEDQTLLIGVKTKDHLLFVSLDGEEVRNLRKKAIVEAVLEAEEKRLNVSGISVFDPKGALYLGLKPKAGKAYKIVKPLSARYFPNYTLEIRMSSSLVRDTQRRTTISFVVRGPIARPDLPGLCVRLRGEITSHNARCAGESGRNVSAINSLSNSLYCRSFSSSGSARNASIADGFLLFIIHLKRRR